MSRIFKIAVPVISLTCMVAFFPWIAACAYLSPLPTSIQEQVDSAVNYGLDGIVVYVDKKGQPPEFYAAGWKNRDNKTPANPYALFKIGSISKLYMAVAAVRLISERKMSLDDTLAEYLPQLVGRIENSDRITLEMLLQHRSGIPDWIDDAEFPWKTSLAQVEQYLELVLDEPADFPPDSHYDYSNTNYLLLGEIIDKVLGYQHQQYIQHEILAPLGLTQTFGQLNDVDLDRVTSGYYRGYDGDVKMLNTVAPGSSMVASVQDVGIFLRALNDGSLFNDDEQAIYSSVYQYGHTGLWPGYSSIARYHEDIDTVVVQFINTSGGNSWMISEIVYERIVRISRKKSFVKYD